jgi:hypothetical protein
MGEMGEMGEWRGAGRARGGRRGGEEEGGLVYYRLREGRDGKRSSLEEVRLELKEGRRKTQ